VKRTRAKRAFSVSRAYEIRFFVILIACLCIPAVWTLIAISSTTTDISDLSPIFEKIGDYTILNWVDLERGPHALKQETRAFTGSRIQALGYMMDTDPPALTGKLVRGFVLQPAAGSLLHPAHRFGDQMIAVRLAAGSQIEFVSGRLVWAKGILRASYGDPAGAKPLYALEEATVFPGNKMDIREYFQ